MSKKHPYRWEIIDEDAVKDLEKAIQKTNQSLAKLKKLEKRYEAQKTQENKE